MSSSTPAQPPGPLPIDPFRVNTDNQRAIEEAHANPPKPRGRPPLNGQPGIPINKQKDRIEEKEIAKIKEEERKAFKAATAIALNEKENEEKKFEEQKRKKEEAETKSKLNHSKLWRKINEYHRTFPEIFGKMKLPPENSPSPVLEACLADMRGMMSGSAADQLIYSMIPKLGYGVEWLVHDVGINPKGWNLRNGQMSFGRLLEDPEAQEMLEPERSEAVIEMRDYFMAPWYARLAIKMAIIADNFSARQPRPGPSKSSSPTQNDEVAREELETSDL